MMIRALFVSAFAVLVTSKPINIKFVEEASENATYGIPPANDGDIVVVESTTIPLGGGFMLEPDSIGPIVDAMLAPILSLQGLHHAASMDPEDVFGMPLFSPFNHLHHHLHRHGHSSLLRHPHVGHCSQDHQDFCEPPESTGIVGLFDTLDCLAANVHRISGRCQGTVTVHTLPCLGDMKMHCHSVGSLHACFGDHAQKFSPTCGQTLMEVPQHSGYVPRKAAPELPRGPGPVLIGGKAVEEKNTVPEFPRGPGPVLIGGKAAEQKKAVPELPRGPGPVLIGGKAAEQQKKPFQLPLAPGPVLTETKENKSRSQAVGIDASSKEAESEKEALKAHGARQET